jgi:hypothetical protein
LHRKPELIHRVKGDFGAAVNVSMQIYYNPKFDWRSYDALHLLTSHRYYRNLTSYLALKHCNEALKKLL